MTSPLSDNDMIEAAKAFGYDLRWAPFAQKVKALHAQLDTVTKVSQQYVDELAAARVKVEALGQERDNVTAALSDAGIPEQYEEGGTLYYYPEAMRVQLLQQQLAAMQVELNQAKLWNGTVTDAALKASIAERDATIREHGEQDDLLIKQGAIIHAQRDRLAILEARNTELEHALRLHLAVAPDDPLLIEPLEQRVVRLEGALKAEQDYLKLREDELLTEIHSEKLAGNTWKEARALSALVEVQCAQRALEG